MPAGALIGDRATIAFDIVLQGVVAPLRVGDGLFGCVEGRNAQSHLRNAVVRRIRGILDSRSRAMDSDMV